MSRIFKNPSSSKNETRTIDQLDIPLGEPIELAVWSVKKTGIRCKLIQSQTPVTFRKVRYEVEGEIITVIPENVWQFKNTVYISGEMKERLPCCGGVGSPILIFFAIIIGFENLSHWWLRFSKPILK